MSSWLIDGSEVKSRPRLSSRPARVHVDQHALVLAAALGGHLVRGVDVELGRIDRAGEVDVAVGQPELAAVELDGPAVRHRLHVAEELHFLPGSCVTRSLPESSMLVLGVLDRRIHTCLGIWIARSSFTRSIRPGVSLPWVSTAGPEVPRQPPQLLGRQVHLLHLGMRGLGADEEVRSGRARRLPLSAGLSSVPPSWILPGRRGLELVGVDEPEVRERRLEVERRLAQRPEPNRAAGAQLLLLAGE